MTRAAKELEAYRARYRAAEDAANNAADARVIAAEESRAMRSAAETFPDLEWLRSHHGDALVRSIHWSPYDPNGVVNADP